MLYFDIRAVESGAQPVDGELDASDAIWEVDDVRPTTSVEVSGRLSVAGPGRFYFTGQLSGAAVVSCRRCLVDASTAVSEPVTGLFAEPGLDDAEEDDVYPIPAGARTIDLRPLVREVWLLSVPSFVTCRPDCQGLCPSCGIDRNVSSCACRTESTDARWDTLRALRDASS
jgi:uncharacterized protein